MICRNPDGSVVFSEEQFAHLMKLIDDLINYREMIKEHVKVARHPHPMYPKREVEGPINVFETPTFKKIYQSTWKQRLAEFNKKMYFIGYLRDHSMGYGNTLTILKRGNRRPQCLLTFVAKQTIPILIHLKKMAQFPKKESFLEPLKQLESMYQGSILYVGVFLDTHVEHGKNRQDAVYVGITKTTSAFDRWGTSGGTDHLSEARKIYNAKDFHSVAKTLTSCGPVIGMYEIMRPEAKVVIFILGHFKDGVKREPIESALIRHLVKYKKELMIRVIRGKNKK